SAPPRSFAWPDASGERGSLALRPQCCNNAIPMPEDMAVALICEPGSPALMERRRYWSNEGILFEVSLSFYLGDRFPQTILVEREI
ncbi:UTRA domain-containing protein, partial [Salipiger aestuarii]